jgi:hypothetical protein
MANETTHSGRAGRVQAGATPEAATSAALTAIWTFCLPVVPFEDRPSGSDWMVGVYFLIDRDEVVYIGQSVNVQARVDAHAFYNQRHENWYPEHIRAFDRAIWMKLPAGEIKVFEAALIRLLRPRHNVMVPRGAPERDGAILSALGLEAA